MYRETDYETTIFSFLQFFCAAYTATQANYYTETKTLKENGYAYQCDVSHGLVKCIINPPVLDNILQIDLHQVTLGL
ncbi:hypothetical protein C3V43_08600 [Bacteroides heparinolyticus]|nr:hypothetical protein C3V43_08600 [Bacteroides heparinolyticus]